MDQLQKERKEDIVLRFLTKQIRELEPEAVGVSSVGGGGPHKKKREIESYAMD